MSEAQSQSVCLVNPLSNPLILTNIFSHLGNISDLKSVRLVSKLWRATIHSHWRASATIRLLWRKDISNFCKCQLTPDTLQSIFKDNTMDISEYLKLMETFDGIPFTRYRIINYCILHPIRDEIDLNVNIFWDTCGNKMKYLHLDHVNFHNIKLYQGFHWLLSEKCSNLEELIMPLAKHPICDEKESFRDESVDAVYDEDSKQAVFLKYLYLKECQFSKWLTIQNRRGQYAYRKYGKLLLNFMPNLKGFKSDIYFDYWSWVLRDTKYFNLEKLSLGELLDMYNFCPFDCLVAKQLKLTTLEIDTHNFTTHRNPIKQEEHCGYLKSTLTICAGSLQRLSFRAYEELEDSGVQNISNFLEHLEFPNLKELYAYDQHFFNFRVLRGMPKLALFHLETDHIKRSHGLSYFCSQFHDSCVPPPSYCFCNTYWNYNNFKISYNWNNRLLREFSGNIRDGDEFRLLRLKHFYLNYSKLTTNSLKIFKELMPNLTSLEIIMNEKTHLFVQKLWPNLKNLRILRFNELEKATPPATVEMRHDYPRSLAFDYM